MRVRNGKLLCNDLTLFSYVFVIKTVFLSWSIGENTELTLSMQWSMRSINIMHVASEAMYCYIDRYVQLGSKIADMLNWFSFNETMPVAINAVYSPCTVYKPEADVYGRSSCHL